MEEAELRIVGEVMKTAEQIYNKYKGFLSAVTKEEAIKVIGQIRKDAYNEAIEDAAQGAKIEFCDDYQGSTLICKQSILKLKK